MGYELTEDTLTRFYADKIKCPWCGNWIHKKSPPHEYYTDERGSIIRKWNCNYNRKNKSFK